MSPNNERHGLHSTQKYAKVLRFGSFAFFTTDLIFKALKKLFFSFKPSQIQPALSRFKSTNTNLTHSQRLSLVCNYAHNCWQSKTNNNRKLCSHGIINTASQHPKKRAAHPGGSSGIRKIYLL
jgi:hypothetical protein